MLRVYEFEFYESEDGRFVVADPFGIGEGTFGEDLRDAVESAADWLEGWLRSYLAKGEEPPEPEFGHDPRHGGRVIAVAVDFDLSKVPAVTAADASRMLGVSTARVAQMCESGALESWRDGSRRMVSLDSVEARLADPPKAGRPRKAATA